MKKALLISCFLSLLIPFQSLYSQEPFWEYFETPEAGSVEKLLIDSEDRLFAFSYNGVFRSTDFGASWEHVFEEPNLAYASIGYNDWILAQKGNRHTQAYLQKTFISKDHGETWTEFEKNWEEIFPDESEDITIYDMLLDNEGKIFLLINYEIFNPMLTDFYVLIMSEDFGKSWKKTNLVYETGGDYRLLRLDYQDQYGIIIYGLCSV
jgi:uncharacterized protein (DUF736 family)